MSYLDAPRLAFRGRFRCDVPTANNGGADAGWNPLGSGAFDLLGCHVTGGESAAGTPITAADPEHRLSVVGAGDRPSAKLVDLDPMWQRSSQIWGLTVRIVVPGSGEELLAGAFRPAAFRDPWARQIDPQAPNGIASGASFTSVLQDVRFGPGADAYPALRALHAACDDGRLSIVLNTFGAYYRHVGDLFATGGLTGALGPWRAGEPLGFVAGRRLAGGGYRRPDGSVVPVGSAAAVVDEAASRVVVDLGNSYALDDPAGTPVAFGPPFEAVELGLLPTEAGRPGQAFPAAGTVLGEVPVAGLTAHAGVLAVPFAAAALPAVRAQPLALVGRRADGRVILSREVADGRHVRADGFVHRIDAPARATTTLHVTDRGVPAATVPVHLSVTGGVLSLPDAPAVDAAAGVHTVTTGSDGTVSVTVEAADPGHPRAPLDGVIATVAYAPRLTPAGALDLTDAGLVPGLDVIVAHVRGTFTAATDPPTWGDVQPILASYAALYPIMGTHLADLGSLEAVRPYRAAILLALTRDEEDPDHMPVTRDLSAAKRAALVAFFEQLDAQATGLRRPPPPASARPALVPHLPDHDAKTELGAAVTARTLPGGAGC